MLSCVQTFLSSYRRLLVNTAHRRGAPATGGMAASIVTGAAAVEAVTRDKRREIEAGVDGFLIYDLALAGPRVRSGSLAGPGLPGAAVRAGGRV